MSEKNAVQLSAAMFRLGQGGTIHILHYDRAPTAGELCCDLCHQHLVSELDANIVLAWFLTPHADLLHVPASS